MEVLFQIFVGLVCLSLLVGGLVLTIFTYEHGNEEFHAIRLLGPVGLFLALALCYGVFGFFTLFDKEFEFSDPGFFRVFFSILGVGLVFSVKNIVAPLFLSIALAWSAYQFLQHGIVDLVPVYDFILDRLLFWAPHWIQITYVWTSLGSGPIDFCVRC